MLQSNIWPNLLLEANHALKSRYSYIDYVDPDNSKRTNSKVPEDQFYTLECALAELAVLELISKNPSIKQGEPAAETGKSLRGVKRTINSLQKKFHPYLIWVSDITYIKVDNPCYYICVILK